ncbi:MAG TPA: cytochrome c peroxidase, partial [Gammaproteobacteria bacterium]|nr:cytochrome c peroxidase [Gammaproteobacteria bacterium]
MPVILILATAIASCSSGGDSNFAAITAAPNAPPAPAPPAPPPPSTAPLDIELFQLITALGLTGDPAAGRDLPSIDDPIPQLGMKLFFSKSLGGGFDTACVSCHHPLLGG